MLNGTFQKISKLYHEYPRTFWTVIVITFIDRIGGSLLFPFFALYITSKFNVGMTDVGVLFAAFSVSSFAGSAIGGALTDRFGRKGIIMFGLIASSFSTVAMGLIDSFQAFFFLALFVGILTDVAGPAHQAMIADILPEEKRADGYGILRVAFNLSVVIGPAIGGLLASRSYLLLFRCGYFPADSDPDRHLPARDQTRGTPRCSEGNNGWHLCWLWTGLPQRGIHVVPGRSAVAGLHLYEHEYSTGCLFTERTRNS
jgi:MFS family permease